MDHYLSVWLNYFHAVSRFPKRKGRLRTVNIAYGPAWYIHVFKLRYEKGRGV